MATFFSADKRRMYGDLAWLWPIISPPEEYVVESSEFAGLIRRYAKITPQSLLNLGCGGGHNDFTLKESFALTGVDISEAMLSLARQLNPDVKYQPGDMRSVRLGQVFDAVTVFDAISYMRSEDSLRSAFKTAFAHLRPGGVFLTVVEMCREKFVQNQTCCTTHRRDDMEIALIENYYDPDPADTWLEANFIYLIRRSGILSVETDCHLLGLFGVEVWPRLLREAGFEVQQVESSFSGPEGNHLPILIGIKPA